MSFDFTAGGDDVCDMCRTSGVTASQTTWCGKTIGVECGCDDDADGCCDDPDCEDCYEDEDGFPPE